jgi:diguanylate cyclase (GGDEF)-like protein
MRRLDTPKNYPISSAMADLNGLKLVNDAYGHLAGDEMRKNSAQIFRFCCRESDIIARWGGDEFVIILPETSSEQTTEIINRRQAKRKVREVKHNHDNNLESEGSFYWKPVDRIEIHYRHSYKE